MFYYVLRYKEEPFAQAGTKVSDRAKGDDRNSKKISL